MNARHEKMIVSCVFEKEDELDLKLNQCVNDGNYEVIEDLLKQTGFSKQSYTPLIEQTFSNAYSKLDKISNILMRQTSYDENNDVQFAENYISALNSHDFDKSYIFNLFLISFSEKYGPSNTSVMCQYIAGFAERASNKKLYELLEATVKQLDMVFLTLLAMQPSASPATLPMSPVPRSSASPVTLSTSRSAFLTATFPMSPAPRFSASPVTLSMPRPEFSTMTFPMLSVPRSSASPVMFRMSPPVQQAVSVLPAMRQVCSRQS